MGLIEVREFPGYKVSINGEVYGPDGILCRTRYLGKYVIVVHEYCDIKRATLVCLAYHGPRPRPKMIVAHKNDIPDDDRPQNLRWATKSENTAEAYANGKIKRGSARHTSTLNEDDVRKIRMIHSEGVLNYTDIADIYNVNKNTIRCIVLKKYWKHVL
jgi:HNH endonuclease